MLQTRQTSAPGGKPDTFLHLQFYSMWLWDQHWTLVWSCPSTVATQFFLAKQRLEVSTKNKVIYSSFYNTSNGRTVCRLLNATQNTEYVYIVIHIEIHIKIEHFWICIRVNIRSSSTILIIMWLSSFYQKLNIWETLCIKFDLFL